MGGLEKYTVQVSTNSVDYYGSNPENSLFKSFCSGSSLITYLNLATTRQGTLFWEWKWATEKLMVSHSQNGKTVLDVWCRKLHWWKATDGLVYHSFYLCTRMRWISNFANENWELTNYKLRSVQFELSHYLFFLLFQWLRWHWFHPEIYTKLIIKILYTREAGWKW